MILLVSILFCYIALDAIFTVGLLILSPNTSLSEQNGQNCNKNR